jgi:phosphomannomutase
VIAFGTDGWRAVLGRDFTEANVIAVGRAFGLALREGALGTAGDRGTVVVGHDTRARGRETAFRLARELERQGLRALVSTGVVPTPAVSWAVKSRGLTAGLMVTASHNPASYNGIKVKAWYGGSALPELYGAVAERLGREASAEPGGSVGEADLLGPYLDYIERHVDAPLLRGRRLRLLWDAMHGATGEAFPAAAARLGQAAALFRGEPDPSFGGLNPEPIPANLGPLRERLKDGAHDLIGAADGDGDRLAMFLPDGTHLTPHHILSLLSLYLLEVKGWRQGLAKTFSSSLWMDRIAEAFGVPLHETGIGFKYLCPLLLEGRAAIAGEESGGVAFRHALPERDAILGFMTVAEMTAARGWSLTRCVEDLVERFGDLHYGRLDLRVPIAAGKALCADLAARPPAEVAGWPVTASRILDGTKLAFGREGWLLFRASGTEELLRIYAEMPSPGAVHAVLEAGRSLAGAPAEP